MQWFLTLDKAWWWSMLLDKSGWWSLPVRHWAWTERSGVRLDRERREQWVSDD